MARPPKPEPRDYQLNLKLTAREYNDVCARAAAVGIRPGEFGRMQLLLERPVRMVRCVAQASRDPALLVQLSRIGNNLNQITRRLHQLDIEVPQELTPLLQRIRQCLETIGDDR